MSTHIDIRVLLPVVKNDRVDFFIKAVESILRQSFRDFSLVVCIDGPSSESIDAYLESIQTKDSRLELFRNKVNVGLATTLNRAIKKFDADIYVRMDSDDIARNDRIEKIVAEFNKKPEVLLVGSECIEIDENGVETFYKKMPSQKKLLPWAYTRNPFGHSTVAFRREFINSVGFYNEKFKKSQDYDLWARAIMLNVKMYNIHEPLIYFRTTQDFWKRRTSWVNIKNEVKVSLMLIKHFNAYLRLPKLGMKVLLRIVLKYAPIGLNKFAYKVFR